MLEKFHLAIAEVPTSREVHRSVYIDSLGGDVRAAMEIGRIVRRREMGVNVIPETSCASACVLVFAAGVDRDIYESPGKAVTFAMLYPAKPGLLCLQGQSEFIGSTSGTHPSNR